MDATITTADEVQEAQCVPHSEVSDPVYSPDAVRYEWIPEMSQSGRDPDTEDPQP